VQKSVSYLSMFVFKAGHVTCIQVEGLSDAAVTWVNLMKHGILDREETIVQLVNQQSAWQGGDKFRKGSVFEISLGVEAKCLDASLESCWFEFNTHPVPLLGGTRPRRGLCRYPWVSA